MSVLHEELALELLRADLEECGDGVRGSALAAGAGAWRPDRLVRALRARGFVIEELPGPRFRLWAEPVSTEPSGANGHHCPPVGSYGGVPGGSVDTGQLRLSVAA